MIQTTYGLDFHTQSERSVCSNRLASLSLLSFIVWENEQLSFWSDRFRAQKQLGLLCFDSWFWYGGRDDGHKLM